VDYGGELCSNINLLLPLLPLLYYLFVRTGWWPQKAVTFLDNHDTGSTQQHWNFPDDKIVMGYAYILTHPGMPCIVRYISFATYMMLSYKPRIAIVKWFIRAYHTLNYQI
jgi:hypothetical protein